jgi:alpha-tubulin suppressor-like RCC1 family protein
LDRVIAIAAHDAYSMALEADGDLVTWGYKNLEPIMVPEAASLGMTQRVGALLNFELIDR